jgi:5-methylcytosine-specific restriction endonuclease McrA
VPWEKTPEERAAENAFYSDPAYRRNKAIVRQRSGGRCEIWENGRQCGSRDRVQCDHIIPRTQGGTHALENLRDACHLHHSRKTAQEGGGFRANRGNAAVRDPRPRPRTKW